MSPTSGPRRAGLSSLRAANIDAVLEALRRGGPSSQAGIARTTGLSPATITSIVRELLEDGRVRSEARNRRESVISLAEVSGRFAALSVETSRLQVMIADFARGERLRLEAPAPSGSQDDGPTALVTLLDRALEEAGLSRGDLTGIALGMQAPISRDTGAVASWASADLPAWRDVRLAEALTLSAGVPTLVDNDANLAAIGELTWGAGQGSEVFCYVLSSSHIGGAIALRGEILHGADGLAGEIGHMVVDDGGPLCHCGSRGCLAVYATEESILRSLRVHGDYGSIRGVVSAARDGDLPARTVLFDVGRRAGRALADVGKLIAPDTMVLGGDLGRAGSLLLGGLRASIEITSLRAVSPAVQFRPARILADEVLLGGIAALLRREGADAGELPRWLRGEPDEMFPREMVPSRS